MPLNEVPCELRSDVSAFGKANRLRGGADDEGEVQTLARRRAARRRQRHAKALRRKEAKLSEMKLDNALVKEKVIAVQAGWTLVTKNKRVASAKSRAAKRAQSASAKKPAAPNRKARRSAIHGAPEATPTA